MERYKDFAPTGFDSKGLNGDRHGISDFVVLLSRNRDSGLLAESNFLMAFKELGGESDAVQIHRFGHWACGWFELLLVDPSNERAFKIAEEIEASLVNYPVLDDEDYSEREWTVACDYWQQMSIRERVEYCQRAKINVFAARRDELPQDDNGALMELLTRD